VTTAGFVSGAREATAPSRCSRGAASASLLLGGVLIATLPDVLAAADYLAILGAAAALVAIVAGHLLRARATLLVRMLVLLAAGSVLTTEVLQILLGLPGVTERDQFTALERGIPSAAAGGVLLLLAADALGRRHEPAPDRPYAL
jgi:hypothetical protein